MLPFLKETTHRTACHSDMGVRKNTSPTQVSSYDNWNLNTGLKNTLESLFLIKIAENSQHKDLPKFMLSLLKKQSWIVTLYDQQTQSAI